MNRSSKQIKINPIINIRNYGNNLGEVAKVVNGVMILKRLRKQEKNAEDIFNIIEMGRVKILIILAKIKVP